MSAAPLGNQFASKPARDRRDKKVSVPLSALELDQLKRRAKNKKVKDLSKFVRGILFDKKPPKGE